jgi:hypothetical protein
MPLTKSVGDLRQFMEPSRSPLIFVPSGKELQQSAPNYWVKVGFHFILKTSWTSEIGF